MTTETAVETKEPPPAMSRRKQETGLRRWAPAAGAAGAALLAVVLVFWMVARNHVSTDDAFIEARVIPVNAKVPGQVLKVNVSDNQPVKAGDVLVEIDPADYRIKLGEAQAQWEADKAQARQAAGDAERADQLFKKDELSRQLHDHAIAAADIARAKADLSQERVEAAKLDLDNTRVVASENGRVGRKGVENGAYIQVGQPLMALVTSDVWVTANFKEIQLARLRPGQKVEIKVDAFPGKTFQGHVDSVQPGTGSRFSMFPPENATGNFVKVVQRVPVKIAFDGPAEALVDLAPGMSADPVVDLR